MTSSYLWTPYAGIYLATAVITIVAFALAWPRRQTPAGAYLSYMMVAITGWNLAVGMEALAAAPETKFFWSKIEYVGSNTAIALFLVFSLAYDRRYEWLPWRRQIWLWLLPVLNMIIAFTNDWHLLLWPGYSASPTIPNLMIYHHGPLFFVVLAVIFSYIFIGAWCIGHQVLQNNWLSRRQGIVMLVATAVPFLASVLYLSEWNPWPGFNLIPASFTLTGLLAILALTRLRLFDLVPIARSQLIENMVNGVLVIDNDQRVIDVNPAARRFLALEEPTAIGRPLTDVLPLAAELLSLGGQSEISLTLADNLFVEVSLTPVYDRGHIQRGWLLLILDVTKRKQAELELRELNTTLEARVAANTNEILAEKEKLETVLRSAGDAIMLLNSDLMIEYVNNAFTQLTGYPFDEAVGKPVCVLSPENQEVLLAQIILQTVKLADVWQGEIKIRHKNGRVYNADLIIAPVFQNDGTLYRFVATHRDIDRQKALTEARNQFMQNVSHQLRTPITNIKLYTDLFVRGRQERWPYYTQVLSDQADRLETLVQGIMDMVDLDSGRGISSWEPLSLTKLIEETASRYRAEAAEKGLALNLVPTPADFPAIFGDEKRLHQALAELLQNGLAFTPPGGQISLRLATAVIDNASWVQIIISDTGPGIPVEEQEQVFERFFRGEAAQGGHLPGVGLGLGIVQAIMQAHGGRVTVQSTPGVGSEFTLWLRPFLSVNAA